MESSRRRKYQLIATVLVLGACAAIWLQPVSAIHNAHNQIRVGMNARQVTEVLERCGWSKFLKPTPLNCEHAWLSLFRLSGIQFDTVTIRRETLTYRGANGETLTVLWEVPTDAQPFFLEGRVAGKEYYSGIQMKLLGWLDRLRRMLHW